jgi:hypothetical protein
VLPYGDVPAANLVGEVVPDKRVEAGVAPALSSPGLVAPTHAMVFGTATAQSTTNVRRLFPSPNDAGTLSAPFSVSHLPRSVTGPERRIARVMIQLTIEGALYACDS